MSLWTNAISAPQMIAATARTGITQRQRRPAGSRPLAVLQREEVRGYGTGPPEHIEGDEVGGHESAGQARRHGEHQSDEAARARSHWRGGDRNHGQERVQDDEPEADAVDAEAVGDAEMRGPRQLPGELGPAVGG